MARKRVKNMKRDQQKAVFYNMSHIQNKMNSRSKQSQRIDRALRARSVYDGRSRKGKDKWMKNPNQVDMKNIDTVIAKKKYQAKKSKEIMKTQKKEIRKINKKIRKTEEKKKKLESKELDYNQWSKERKEKFIKEHDIRTNEDLERELNNEGHRRKVERNIKQAQEQKKRLTSERKPESFMTYREYNLKQKDLQAKIKKANQDIGFAYDNMGRVDTDAEKRQQKYINESKELEEKARGYSKKHPGWIDGIGDKKRLAEARSELKKQQEKWEKGSDVRADKMERYNKELSEAYKKRDQKKTELKETQVKHIHNRRAIGHWSLSPKTVKQAERMTPQQRSDFTRDIEYWYKNRESSQSFTSSEQKEINRIKAKYNVDNGLGTYLALTGELPKPPKNKSNTYQRMHASDSPAGKELDNTLKLDKLKKAVDSVESKNDRLTGIQSKLDYANKRKDWAKKDIEKTKPSMQTKTQRRELREAENDIDKFDTDLLHAKRNYDKYVEGRKKDISRLKSDPNIKIHTQSINDSPDNKDVVIEYTGSYVNSKKVIPSVNKSVISELNL